ncbi:MAG: hypothetical protein HZB75_01040 [Candidatus Saccharibacteria bacterium]|nr:MAG: hypothetical protein HZB75_01040 [Candidatus Saccharibacteria bacterium]
MNILVFGFKGNISEEILAELNTGMAKYVLASNEAEIKAFIERVKFNDFDYVLGMGVYSGADASKIRIETTFTSQFHNDKKGNHSVTVTPFLHESTHFKIAKRAGNSYCNLVSYLFTSKYPKIPYCFLHIPKSYPLTRAIGVINAELEGLEYL